MPQAPTSKAGALPARNCPISEGSIPRRLPRRPPRRALFHLGTPSGGTAGVASPRASAASIRPRQPSGMSPPADTQSASPALGRPPAVPIFARHRRKVGKRRPSLRRDRCPVLHDMPSCLPNRTGCDVVGECRKGVCLWFVLFDIGRPRCTDYCCAVGSSDSTCRHRSGHCGHAASEEDDILAPIM